MVSIYAIEDINDLIYVGSTKQKLNKRLSMHRSDKRNKKYCSSSKLNLDYCIIYELERCEQKDRKEKEQYWIDKLESINDRKLNVDRKEILLRKKQYYKNNKEQIDIYQKQYRDKNKDKMKEYKRQYWKLNKEEIKRKRKENKSK